MMDITLTQEVVRENYPGKGGRSVVMQGGDRDYWHSKIMKKLEIFFKISISMTRGRTKINIFEEYAITVHFTITEKNYRI